MFSKSIFVWIRNAALFLIIAAFVVFYGPQQQSEGANSVGAVNGESLHVSTFEMIRDRYSEDEQRLRDQGMNSQTVRDLIDRQVRDQMVRLLLLAQASREQGFRVSDTEVGQALCAEFADATGRCDPALIRAQLDQAGFPDERPYVEFLRQRLLVGKLNDFLAQSINISRGAARERLKRERTTLKIRYVQVPIDASASAVQPSADDIADFAKRESARIGEEYERRRSEFQKPEEVRARHILLTGTDARDKAQAALDKIKGGEDFAKLAAELSQDPATAQSGGDLGFFPRNRMEPEFEKAVFDAEPQALLGPIETKRGFHVIRVEEKHPAVDRSLEDATTDLARELLARERAQATARTKAEGLAAELAKGKRLPDIAQAESLPIQETPGFAASATRVPGLPPIPGLQGTALSLTMDKPASDQVFVFGDAFYVIELAELNTPKPEEFEAELEPARQTLVQRAQQELLEEVYRRKRTEADADGSIVLPNLYDQAS